MDHPVVCRGLFETGESISEIGARKVSDCILVNNNQIIAGEARNRRAVFNQINDDLSHANTRRSGDKAAQHTAVSDLGVIQHRIDYR